MCNHYRKGGPVAEFSHVRLGGGVFHDRMPVVLSDTEALEWLGDTPLADNQLQRLCRGLPAEALDHERMPPKLKITKTGTKAATPPSASPDDDQPTLL